MEEQPCTFLDENEPHIYRVKANERRTRNELRSFFGRSSFISHASPKPNFTREKIIGTTRDERRKLASLKYATFKRSFFSLSPQRDDDDDVSRAIDVEAVVEACIPINARDVKSSSSPSRFRRSYFSRSRRTRDHSSRWFLHLQQKEIHLQVSNASPS